MKELTKQTLTMSGFLLVFGIGLVGITSSFVPFPLLVEKMEIYGREDKPDVMRIFKRGKDGIFLENPDEPGIYDVSFGRYLRGIEDRAERDREKIKIRELAGFYD